ncbi:MAG: NUDIX domain-containing protein [Victivallales bacterium]|nr:NUDIX domain-containing protein [Victivallales bacterium]
MYTDVTAAVISINGKYLLTTRPEGKHLEGYWEFPGGKVKNGEQMGVSVKREIYEELGVFILPLDILFKIGHRYTDKSVRITFFRAVPENIKNFTPFPYEKQKIGFFHPAELKKLDIVPADKPLIQYLTLLINN